MRAIEIEHLIKNSNIPVLDQREILEEISKMQEETYSHYIFVIILSEVLQRNLSKRKHDKIFNEVSQLCAMRLMKEFHFHKFEYEELKQPIIRAAFMETVIGHSNEYSNFVEKTYLKGMLLALEGEKNRTLTTLIERLTKMYELARKDEKEESDLLTEALISISESGDNFVPLIKCKKEERVTRTLAVLNKTKNYNNTAEDSYVVTVSNKKLRRKL